LNIDVGGEMNAIRFTLLMAVVLWRAGIAADVPNPVDVADAAALSVDLKLERSTCGNTTTPVVRNPALTWISSSTASVAVTKFDMPNMRISERNPKVIISGMDLSLCYNYEPPEQNSTYSNTCAIPVRLEFVVSGLKGGGDYKVSVGPCWPKG
jgi:hypothetical protein